MYTFTVIIPHKNIPKLLRRCLDSIPQRDDLEVIVVDDDSDPTIVDFNNFPGKNRQNTTIIYDKSGKGAGRARNIGLEHAQGIKILFADADDFFNYCFSDMLDLYKDDLSDIVFFNACCLDSEYYTTNANRFGYLNRFINNFDNDPETSELQLKYDFGPPWCKIIKKSMVDRYHIKFDECSINNDTTFSYLIGYYSKVVKVDKHALYCVTYREDSITFTIDENKILTIIDVQTNRDVFFREKKIQYKNTINNHYRKMTELYLSGNTTLFNKCIAIFEKKGIHRKEVMKVIYKRIIGNKIAPFRRLLKFLHI